MTTITFIGAGSGGYEGAIRAAQLGADVYIVENDQVGGTCLNRGCIPTKTYWRNAEIANTFSRKDEFGFKFDNFEVDGKRMQDRKNEVVEQMKGGIEFLLSSYDNITFYKGTAKFKDEKTLEVELNEGGSEIIETDYTVVATGTRPFVPPIQGAEVGDGIMTSDELLDIDYVPESLVVIGGGVIGMEFACIYNELGTEVSVISDAIVGAADGEISKRFTSMAKKAGINVVSKSRAQSIEKSGDKYKVTAENNKGKVQELEGQIVLIATGRKAVVDTCGLENTGVEYHDWGIPVDENCKTNVESIYAVGDCIEGSIQLAHAAAAQSIAVAEMIMGEEVHTNLDVIPACTFTLPEIAQVGKTEEQLKEEGISYEKAKFNFSANGKAVSMGEGEGFVKILAAEDFSEVYGVHILGPHASDLIHEAVPTVANKRPLSDLANAIHAHPTLAETTMEAVHALEGKGIHTAPSAQKLK